MRGLRLALLALALLAPTAHAHWADLAAAELVLDGAEAHLDLTVATGLLAAADLDRDGVITDAEAERERATLEAVLERQVVVEDDRGRPGALRLLGARGAGAGLGLTPGSHSTLRLSYRWPEAPRALRLRYELFLPDVPSASLVLTVYRDGAVESFVLTPERRTLTVAPGERAPLRQAVGFARLGVEHILGGYDHLLFLLTLLLLGGGLRTLLKIVTAFTVAHSVTLSLAALGVLALPPRLVESGIALSIAYVAAENLWRDPARAARGRWLLTFGFGLVHGLGFAGVLRDLALPGGDLALSLVSFNLGVEIGQVAVVSAAYALLAAVRRLGWEAGVRRWVSGGAVAVGVFWFVQRAFPF